MHQSTLRALALAGPILILSCGGSDEPGGTSTDRGGTASTAGAPGTAGSTNASGGNIANTGGTSSAAGAAAGGTANVAGSNPGTAGTATGTAGTATGTAGSGGTSPQGEYWVAPDGDDSHAGTEAAPFKTIRTAVAKAKPGVKIWLKPGTYASIAIIDIIFSYSGTAEAPVTMQAAPGGGRPVLDFTGQMVGNDDMRGINLMANYWRIKGLEVKKTGDNCIAISGSNNIIEDVITHECGDTGIQITAPSNQATDDSRAANNLILNCDSWGNLDSATGGENADGFAAKLRIGPGNVFRGCRAWNNADDGWDLFAADDVVTIEDSWAFSNGKPLGGSNPQGDGNGFKLGGEPNGAGQGGAVHLVNRSFAFENKSCGFVRNNNPETPKLTSCGAKDNEEAYCSLSVSSEVDMTMSAATARTIARTANGSLPPMQ